MQITVQRHSALKPKEGGDANAKIQGWNSWRSVRKGARPKGFPTTFSSQAVMTLGNPIRPITL
jgi:hypothetical protein